MEKRQLEEKEETRKKLEDALREGYKATRNEDRVLSKEWESTAGDGIY